jgi:hypothetical protein
MLGVLSDRGNQGFVPVNTQDNRSDVPNICILDTRIVTQMTGRLCYRLLCKSFHPERERAHEEPDKSDIVFLAWFQVGFEGAHRTRAVPKGKLPIPNQSFTALLSRWILELSVERVSVPKKTTTLRKYPYLNGIIRRVEVEQVRIQVIIRVIFDDHPISSVVKELEVGLVTHDTSARFWTIVVYVMPAVCFLLYLTGF